MKLTLNEIIQSVSGRLYQPFTEKLAVTGVSTDSRKISKGDLFVPLIGERFDGHQFIKMAEEQGAVVALWQSLKTIPKDVKIPFILVADTLVALQDLAKYYRKKINPTIVAVTGSNGKTTTKDLIASVLSTTYSVHKTKGNLNNHIGVPLTLLTMPEETELAVIEMGMSNKGEIALLSEIAKPQIAVITNIGESHIEFLGSRKAIAAAKLEVIEGLQENGTLILNGDEPLLRDYLANQNLHFHLKWVGENKENDVYPVKVNLDGTKGIQFNSQDQVSYSLPLLGLHNVINALMAVEVGKCLHISIEKIQQGLKDPKLTSMRLEKMIAKNGAILLNDVYNASPTSMKASLQLLSTFQNDKKIAVLGDMLELGEYAKEYHLEIGRVCAGLQIDLLVTTGKDGRWIAEGAKEAGMVEEQVHYIKDFNHLSEFVLQHSNQKTMILLKASRGVHLEKVVESLV
ncbi:UDP-N-acetylmuramoyl-tripeptide--D-alanyl-D-alanine ligase [Tepidibacillus decaturensis]|uniref:UDP-N-acetylmuramoyl-tripeptide--D-alanyl-D-alanine ligase n=1 Tax=Tepidibacillus decaturensis TaxID=1413211 RepID=A0A135L434_9BACI|nr:UDP-N-acetylmuramoyl-tripeptide--D-alanyl-D-alanine ligase [Tepidibacillus decaturensis]KXG43775.1 hypothetical protein U473_06930 [Tepidibacillus decaturensis]